MRILDGVWSLLQCIETAWSCTIPIHLHSRIYFATSPCFWRNTWFGSSMFSFLALKNDEISWHVMKFCVPLCHTFTIIYVYIIYVHYCSCMQCDVTWRNVMRSHVMQCAHACNIWFYLYIYIYTSKYIPRYIDDHLFEGASKLCHGLPCRVGTRLRMAWAEWRRHW